MSQRSQAHTSPNKKMGQMEEVICPISRQTSLISPN